MERLPGDRECQGGLRRLPPGALLPAAVLCTGERLRRHQPRAAVHGPDGAQRAPAARLRAPVPSPAAAHALRRLPAGSRLPTYAEALPAPSSSPSSSAPRLLPAGDAPAVLRLPVLLSAAAGPRLSSAAGAWASRAISAPAAGVRHPRAQTSVAVPRRRPGGRHQAHAARARRRARARVRPQPSENRGRATASPAAAVDVGRVPHNLHAREDDGDGAEHSSGVHEEQAYRLAGQQRHVRPV
mmetsp:Transcript_106578/g.306573  ORF Transcript_106578/g.306573 Transcript_106578/m.306573 type:complete len:241 (+) Transcript_106578:488-1210(+)